MLFRNPLSFILAVSLMGGLDAQSTKITIATSGTNPKPNSDVTKFDIDFGLDAALASDQTVEINYYSDTACSTPVTGSLSTGTSFTTPPTTGDTAFTLTEEVSDLDSAITPTGTGNNVYGFCVRATLKTATVIMDILEVNVVLTTSSSSTFSITSINGNENTPGSGTVSNTFTASAYLCSPGTPETALTTAVNEGDPFSICFKSDQWSTAGIVDLTALSLTSSLFGAGGASKTQNYIIGGAPLFSANTCEQTGAGSVNGDGAALAASVQYCSVTIDQIPTTFFLDGQANDDAEDIAVSGSATVTLQVGASVGSGRRLVQHEVRFMLEEGDTGPVGAAISAFTATREEDSCDCAGGFFFIICWFFKCLLGFF